MEDILTHRLCLWQLKCFYKIQYGIKEAINILSVDALCVTGMGSVQSGKDYQAVYNMQMGKKKVYRQQTGRQVAKKLSNDRERDVNCRGYTVHTMPWRQGWGISTKCCKYNLKIAI